MRVVNYKIQFFPITLLEFSVPAQVPGGIYSDLDAFGGIFRNPIFHDYNDVENRWVGRTNWTFSRAFTGRIYINI